jgi:hypothetical protein
MRNHPPAPYRLRLNGTRSVPAALACLALFGVTRAQPAEDADAAYTRVINERADKIVAQLAIEHANDRLRVRDLIAGQYRALSKIHDARDAKTMTADEASAEQFALHRRFVAQLEAQLTPEQVDKVKDGLTYGVVPITYRAYRELLPELTAEQKCEIKAQLLEAREYAMDAGSSEEKHAWFGKYKGRINNYLSAAGYDLKQAERDRAARQDVR